MPTALRIGPYRFFFYAGDGAEPRHVHAERDKDEAKFWIDPEVSLARNRGFTTSELRTIEAHIQTNVELLRDAWDDFFNP